MDHASNTEFLDDYVSEVVRVEMSMRSSQVNSDVQDLGFNIDDLAKWSRILAGAQSNIMDLSRHHEM